MAGTRITRVSRLKPADAADAAAGGVRAVCGGRALWPVMVLAMACGGCGVQMPRLIRTPTRPVDQVTVGAMAEPLAGASAADWSADATRLAADVKRTVRDLHWGMELMAVTPWEGGGAGDGAAGGAKNGSGGDDELSLVRAQVLSANGRPVTVIAQPADAAGKRVSVAVRVGHFGDAAAQQLFIDTLAGLLAGKAAPKRGWGFQVPGVEKSGKAEETESRKNGEMESGR